MRRLVRRSTILDDSKDLLLSEEAATSKRSHCYQSGVTNSDIVVSQKRRLVTPEYESAESRISEIEQQSCFEIRRTEKSMETKEDIEVAEKRLELVLDSWDEMDDVSISLNTLFNMTTLGPLKCAFLHQLYWLYTNRTYVDKAIDRLRSQGKLRLFDCQAGALLVQTTDYCRDLDRAAAAATASDQKSLAEALRAFRTWVTCPHTSVLRSNLIAGNMHGTTGATAAPLEPAQLQLLERAGFLKPRRDSHTQVEAFWLHHPAVGAAMVHVLQRRRQILQIVRRTRFKEVSERQLGKARLSTGSGPQEPAVPFALEFLLQDLLGQQLLSELRTPSGERLFRLPGGP